MISSLQESLKEDLTFCRIPHEKTGDLSTLIYFIERSESGEVLPELKQVFVDGCG